MKQKLLFVMDGLKIGGVEVSLLSVLHRLDYTKYDVDLFLIHDDLELLEQVPPQVRVLGFAQMQKGNVTPAIGGMYLLYRLCRIVPGLKKHAPALSHRVSDMLHGAKIRKNITKKYDAVIGYKQGEAEDFVARLMQHPNKIVFYHHGSLLDEKLHQVCYAKVNKIAAVSRGVADMLKQRYPMYANKISVIANYIDADTVLQKAKAYPAQKPATLCLATVGRLVQEKRYDLVVQAAKYLKDHGKSDFVWWLIGDGPERETIRQQIADAQLENSVLLMGSMENPMPYIAAADVYIQPSDAEAFGLAMQEALILHTKVVTSKTIGGKLLVRDGQNGIYVEQTAEDIAAGIEKVLQLPPVDIGEYRDCCHRIDRETDQAWEVLLGNGKTNDVLHDKRRP